jgi:uncharacterized membrane protein
MSTPGAGTAGAGAGTAGAAGAGTTGAAASPFTSPFLMIIACAVFPFSISVTILQAIANKDTVENYTLVWLLFGASYLIGLVLYLLVVSIKQTRENVMYTILTFVMICFTMVVASGGVTALAIDAVNSVSS